MTMEWRRLAATLVVAATPTHKVTPGGPTPLAARQLTRRARLVRHRPKKPARPPATVAEATAGLGQKVAWQQGGAPPVGRRRRRGLRGREWITHDAAVRCTCVSTVVNRTCRLVCHAWSHESPHHAECVSTSNWASSVVRGPVSSASPTCRTKHSGNDEASLACPLPRKRRAVAGRARAECRLPGTQPGLPRGVPGWSHCWPSSRVSGRCWTTPAPRADRSRAERQRRRRPKMTALPPGAEPPPDGLLVQFVERDPATGVAPRERRKAALRPSVRERNNASHVSTILPQARGIAACAPRESARRGQGQGDAERLGRGDVSRGVGRVGPEHGAPSQPREIRTACHGGRRNGASLMVTACAHTQAVHHANSMHSSEWTQPWAAWEEVGFGRGGDSGGATSTQARSGQLSTQTPCAFRSTQVPTLLLFDQK